jgi:hypothetical protein
VEADHPLAFLGYGGFVYRFFFVFLSFWQDCSSQDVFFGEVAEPKCRQRDFLALFFTVFLLILEARSTRLRRFLIDTRPPAVFPGVFCPCRRKHRSYWSSVIGAWCTHAWELSAPWCACGHAPPFFSGHGRWHRVLRPTVFSPLSHCQHLVLGFLLFVFVFFILFVSGLSLLVFGSNLMGIFVGKLLD